MTAPAHIAGGHWWEALLYLAPVLVVVLALRWSGRRLEDDEPDHPRADGDGAA